MGNQYPAFDFQSCLKLNNSLKSRSLSREEMISKFFEPLLTYQEQSPEGKIKVLVQGERTRGKKSPCYKGVWEL